MIHNGATLTYRGDPRPAEAGLPPEGGFKPILIKIELFLVSAPLQGGCRAAAGGLF